MATQYVRRGSDLAPDQQSRPGSNPIFVDSDTNTLKHGTGDSGSSLKEVAPMLQEVTTITGDGAITIRPGIVRLTKGSAAAITLAAPTAAQEGTVITITAGSAFAHVVTATNLLNDGVTGGAKDTATFGAFVGSAITLAAINLEWTVVSKNVVTIA